MRFWEKIKKRQISTKQCLRRHLVCPIVFDPYNGLLCLLLSGKMHLSVMILSD
jgi:hypothetical protein